MARRNGPQDDENGGDNPTQKQSRKQMRKDIQTLQQRVLQAEEDQQRTQRHNQALQAQLGGRAGSVEAEADTTNHKKLSKMEIKAWKLRARIAGSRAVALYEPFINIEPLAGHRVQTHFAEILDDVKRAQESDDELEDVQNPAIYWDTPRFNLPDSTSLVREMIYHLPKSPGKVWLEDWFQDALRLGARKQRSSLMHKVQVYYEKIFDFKNPAFNDRSTRPNLPEVQALQDFLHINEKDDDGYPNLEVFFRDMVMVRVLRLMLFGQSAIRSGKRSPKARDCYSKLWHVTHITPSLLAYAATVIQFVLSGDPWFDEGSGTVNYTAWFHGRLCLLERVYERHEDVYNGLIDYYNKEVFGIDRQDADDDQGGAAGALDTGLDANDLAFLDQI